VLGTPVYSFLLEEISNEPNFVLRGRRAANEPDLKVFIEPKEQSGIGIGRFARNFVPASEVDAYQREIQGVRDQAATRRIARMRRSCFTGVRSSFAAAG
jgi:hypothetical protein